MPVAARVRSPLPAPFVRGLNKVIKQWEAHPDTCYMPLYVVPRGNARAALTRPQGCGTAGCIAGWYWLLTTTKAERLERINDYDAAALEKFTADSGLTTLAIDNVVHAGNWPEPFREAYSLDWSQRRQTRAAINRVKHFIKTGS